MPSTSDVACVDAVASPASPPEADELGPLGESWDAHAKEWIDWVRAPGCPDSYWRFHRDHFLKLVPEPGKLTIDIGCGEGRVGRDLQKLGHRVLGFDLSETMCRASISHPLAASPAIQADASKLPLADRSADCAIAFMSLQDIDDMTGAIEEIARVLKYGASLAMAIVHPMYSGGGFSENEDLFVFKRSYFKKKRLVSIDNYGSLTVKFFREHRPLQAYTQALNEAGFNIEKLLEITDNDQSSRHEGVPMFLDVLATRRPRKSRRPLWLAKAAPFIYGVSGLIVGVLAMLVTARL
jgi:ubiquinone/menaquinone biosynthesis C-methylase UbiE